MSVHCGREMDVASDRCQVCGVTAEELDAGKLIRSLYHRLSAGDPGVVAWPGTDSPCHAKPMATPCPYLGTHHHGADGRFAVLVYYWARGTRLCVGFGDKDTAEEFIAWRRKGWPGFTLECVHDNAAPGHD